MNLLVLIGASLLTCLLWRLVGLTALHGYFYAVAVKVALVLPTDALPRIALGFRGFTTSDQILVPLHLDASIHAGLLILLFATVTYAVVVRFGAARYLRAASRDDATLIVSPLRSAIRSASLRSSAVMTLLTVVVACYSFRLWEVVDNHLYTSEINYKVVNNGLTLTSSSLGAGVGAFGQTLVFLAMVLLALLASIWWVDRRARRLAERARITEVVCGRCGYAKQGRASSARCPECGEMNAPLPSPLFPTPTFVVLAATLVLTVTMGPLVVGLVVGLFQE